MSKKLIYILFIAILTSNCSSTDQNEQTTVVTPTLVAKGSLFGSGNENITEQNLVISNSNDWNALTNQMSTSNIYNFPEIDFLNYKVIAVFDAVKMQGGFSIKVNSIIETDNAILVSVIKETAIDDTGNAVLWIEQPFHIVKIPQTSKPIVFK